MGDLMMSDLCGAGFNVLRKAFFVFTNFYCPNRGAMGIIVVACPPWRITLLYHIPLGSFDCVMSRPITVVR